jgi:hypothetical protein
VADLDRFELCGVGFRDEIARLSFLGPSSDEAFCYPAKGLSLDSEDGLFEGFVLALRRGVHLCSDTPERVHPFAGRVRIAGRDWAPQELTGSSDFLEAWGDPYWRDEDDNEILLFFEFAGHEIQVELGLDGVPLVIVACSPPLMADPEQRRSYGVTNDWPPTHTRGGS